MNTDCSPQNCHSKGPFFGGSVVVREPFTGAASGCARMEVLSSVGAMTDDNRAWLSLRMHCNKHDVLHSLLHTVLACCYGAHADASHTDSGASHRPLVAIVNLLCRLSYCRRLRSSLPPSLPFCCSLKLKCSLRWLLAVGERTHPLLLSKHCC